MTNEVAAECSVRVKKITLDNGTCMWMLKTTWEEALLVRNAYRAGELSRTEARAKLYPLFRGDRYFRVKFKID